VGYAKLLVTALRSLLRFLYLEGHTPTLLTNAAPAIASWKLAPLPRAVEPRQVQALVRRCDRRTAIGRRDVAILTLLTRLGLRGGEVIALELDDIDWRCGEITIAGKGRRHERLPLPPDVGEALASYLRRGRPRTRSRKVFVRHRAPYSPLGPSAITGRICRLCDRAGIARISAHRLRHTAATQMLHHGAPLEEIAEVLRHRDLLTTAIYAKVDRKALRELARSWPGGVA
jgi:site-specific recombinase XerD